MRAKAYAVVQLVVMFRTLKRNCKGTEPEIEW